jgi:hypothetical protein
MLIINYISSRTGLATQQLGLFFALDYVPVLDLSVSAEEVHLSIGAQILLFRSVPESKHLEDFEIGTVALAVASIFFLQLRALLFS